MRVRVTVTQEDIDQANEIRKLAARSWATYSLKRPSSSFTLSTGGSTSNPFRSRSKTPVEKNSKT